jgi:ABC-type transporter Mla subunit MlaD
MPDIPTTIKDAAYVTVGLGVLAFQRAQVQRVELTKQAREEMGRLGGTLEEGLKTVEERLGALQEQVEKALDDLGDRLPDAAADALEAARTTAKEAQAQLRNLVGSASTPASDVPPGAQRAASPKS